MAARVLDCCIRAQAAYTEAAALVEVLKATEDKGAIRSLSSTEWAFQGATGVTNELYIMRDKVETAERTVQRAQEYVVQTAVQDSDRA